MDVEHAAMECHIASSQIESLVVAAISILTGNEPGNDVDRNTVVYDILDVIGLLSTKSKDTSQGVHYALLMKRIDPENLCVNARQ